MSLIKFLNLNPKCKEKENKRTKMKTTETMISLVRSFIKDKLNIDLEDFRQKIISYEENDASFLINLRRIQDDKELEKTLIGLEQLKSYSRLKTFEQINYINLDCCKLTDIPEEVFNFSNLSALSLDNNFLTTLPDSIINLHNLKRLYLTNNKINNFPSSLESLTSLESIYLSYNQIGSLPSSLENLKNLRSLYLKNNNLKTVPDIFKTLKLSIFY
ncbi:unnamed protein product [marine sediment metagenome]|uniref:Disease resistance R13L4/SHOC-2-like LRR domain-containing protein n=1 Tax=marine sediment metagenome TaxID=412755 RepID=X1QE45_9ZZZZ